MTVSRLKYLSMNLFIDGPKKYMRDETRKNLALLLRMDAITNMVKSTLKKPADIVNTL